MEVVIIMSWFNQAKAEKENFIKDLQQFLQIQVYWMKQVQSQEHRLRRYSPGVGIYVEFRQTRRFHNQKY